jgi:hypothetical protein
MWGTPHAPLSQQRFSFFVTAPYNVMRFVKTNYFFVFALSMVLIGCDTAGVAPIEPEAPDYDDISLLTSLRGDDPSPVFEAQGMSERDRVYIQWGIRNEADLQKLAIYRVHDDSVTHVETVNGSALEMEESGLTAGSYDYALRSYYTDHSLNGTDWVSVDVNPSENLPNISVHNLSATPASGQITLEWDLPTDGTLTDVTVTQYSQSGGQSPNKTVSVGADATSFVDDGLAADTYYYEVKTVFEEPSRNGQATATVTLN